MYLPSGSPIFPNRAACLAARAACSDAAIAQAKMWSLQGRLASYNTLIDPAQVLQTFGMGAAVNTALMQSQTQSARATGLVVTTPTTDTTSGGSIPSSSMGTSPSAVLGTPTSGALKRNNVAPTVLPMNPHVTCSAAKAQKYTPPPKPVPPPRPSMPSGAPYVVETDLGPMNYAGPPATTSGKPNAPYAGPPAKLPGLPVGRYMQIVQNPDAGGLSGISPSWGDAALQPVPGADGADLWAWVSDHPWLALGLAGVGVFALTKKKGRRR